MEIIQDPFQVQITVADNQGATDSLTFILNYLGADYDPITVPNFITPNADYINDNWSIVTSEILDVFNLNLYSRWGTLIYTPTFLLLNGMGEPKPVIELHRAFIFTPSKPLLDVEP